ncbi:MAG: hypothetical protein GY794_21785 [bacterium]|nr:hypothetical protein [bacterium]
MDHAEIHPDLDSDQTPPPPPQIPWEQRKQIGRISAYCRMAWMVMINPSQLEQFLNSPVCEKHAKKFRRVTIQLTVIVTMTPLIVALLKVLKLTQKYGPRGNMARSIEPGVYGRLIFGGLSLLALILATRSLEWFSSPKGFKPIRQDRAIALSCYLCASILVVAFMGGIVSLATILSLRVEYMQTTIRVFNLCWLAVFLIWWPVTVRGIYHTAGRSTQRTTIAALTLPLIWFGQQVLVVIVPTFMVQWVLMVASFL